MESPKPIRGMQINKQACTATPQREGSDRGSESVCVARRRRRRPLRSRPPSFVVAAEKALTHGERATRESVEAAAAATDWSQREIGFCRPSATEREGGRSTAPHAAALGVVAHVGHAAQRTEEMRASRTSDRRVAYSALTPLAAPSLGISAAIDLKYWTPVTSSTYWQFLVVTHMATSVGRPS